MARSLLFVPEVKADAPSAIERFASRITEWSGSTAAIVGSLAICVGWAVTGPIFHYSDAWQLVINSITNIATFVMVFLIQRAQNKDSLAVHLKLNELIAAKQGASNRVIAIDELSEAELHRLHERYIELSRVKDEECRESTSIDERRESKSIADEHREATSSNAQP